MVRGDIQLDGNGYRLKPFDDGSLIRPYLVDPFAPAFVTEGRQQQERIQSYTSRVFSGFGYGMGRNRISAGKANDSVEYQRFWSADCETRFSDVRLPILAEDSTGTGLEVVRGSASFKGDFWSIWEDDTGTDIVVRKYTGSTTTWEGGGTVSASVNLQVGLDIIAHKTRLIVVFTLSGTGSVLIRHSTDGVTWAAPTGTAIPTGLMSTGTLHEDKDAGLLAEIGGEIVAVLWNQNNGTVTFFSSADIADTWKDEDVDLPSGNGPQGVAVFPGIDNADKLYVGTREGLYEVDTAPGTWLFRLIFPMNPHNDNCRRMTIHNGALWFAQGVDNNSPAPVIRMTTQGETRIFETDMGLNALDGVPSDLLGPVRWMKSINEFLFVSIGGGAASRNARVLCHNGLGWHHMTKHGTADRKIQWIDVSADDDGVPRLHYSVRTSSSVSNTRFLGQPLVHPASGVSINRETSGTIDFPEIDGGMPGISAAWLQGRIDAIGVSASTSGEYVEVNHGLDGAVRTTTDLGDILSGTKKLDYASGAGEAGVSDALRLVLNRDGGTNTDTPIVRSVEMDYLKQPPTLEGFELQIDLDATAEMLEDTDVETIVTNLETTRDKSTLPTFQFANITQLYVKVRKLALAHDVDVVGEGGQEAVPDAIARRGGVATLLLERVIN
jgi:hypothetical protein